MRRRLNQGGSLRHVRAALKLSRMRRQETKGWVRHGGSRPSLVHFPSRQASYAPGIQACQGETKLERSLHYHPPRLEMAPRWSELSLFNIGQEQTVGNIRVLTGVGSRV